MQSSKPVPGIERRRDVVHQPIAVASTSCSCENKRELAPKKKKERMCPKEQVIVLFLSRDLDSGVWSKSRAEAQTSDPQLMVILLRLLSSAVEGEFRESRSVWFLNIRDCFD